MPSPDPMERFKRLEEEVSLLKTTVSELRDAVTDLREGQRAFRDPVEALLGQRGLPILAHGDLSRTLLPPGGKEYFYQLMRRYSFRLFLRDLIQFPEGADLGALTRYCSSQTVHAYLRDLDAMGVLTLGPGQTYQLLSKRIRSFGPTLEWYVSEILQREFMAPTLFSVRLQHTRFGGDYDVIAIVNGLLVYVEAKSSPPRGVELPAVCAFLNRIQDLQPQMAVFLVDTELRMKDKIVPLFEEALATDVKPSRPYEVVRLVNEIFHIQHGVYLVNSRKGIYSNLRFCFRDFLRAAKKTGASLCPPVQNHLPQSRFPAGS
jgi:hypothetical protein